MADDDWVTDDKGQIIINPLVEYKIALFHGAGICVQLSLADRSLEAGSPLAYAQVAMTPPQARQLASDLQQWAGLAERPATPDESKH